MELDRITRDDDGDNEGPAASVKPTRFPRWMAGLKTHEVVLKNFPACGMLLPDRREIWIRRGLPRQEQIVSLIHELLHIHYKDLDRYPAIPPDREHEVEMEARAIYERLTPREHGLLECFLPSASKRKAGA